MSSDYVGPEPNTRNNLKHLITRHHSYGSPFSSLANISLGLKSNFSAVYRHRRARQGPTSTNPPVTAWGHAWGHDLMLWDSQPDGKTFNVWWEYNTKCSLQRQEKMCVNLILRVKATSGKKRQQGQVQTSVLVITGKNISLLVIKNKTNNEILSAASFSNSKAWKCSKLSSGPADEPACSPLRHTGGVKGTNSSQCRFISCFCSLISRR